MYDDGDVLTGTTVITVDRFWMWHFLGSGKDYIGLKRWGDTLL